MILQLRYLHGNPKILMRVQHGLSNQSPQRHVGILKLVAPAQFQSVSSPVSADPYSITAKPTFNF